MIVKEAQVAEVFPRSFGVVGASIGGRADLPLSLVADSIELASVFGISTLNDLRGLGSSLSNDRLDLKLDLKSSILAKGNLDLLAGKTPDLLIAANSFLGLVGDSSQGRRIGEKLTGRSICQISVQLSELNNRQFEALLEQVAAASPNLVSRPPIWQELGRSLMERFVDRQYEAYLTRLSLNPDDPAALKIALSIKDRPETVRMKNLLGVILCDELRAFSPTSLKILREIGKVLCKRENLEGVVAQLKRQNGKIDRVSIGGIEVSARFLHQVSEIAHRAWMKSRCGLEVLPEASTKLTRGSYNQLFVEYRDLPPATQLYDQINSVALLAEIAKMSDDDFSSLIASSDINGKHVTPFLEALELPKDSHLSWDHPLAPFGANVNNGRYILKSAEGYLAAQRRVEGVISSVKEAESEVLAGVLRGVDAYFDDKSIFEPALLRLKRYFEARTQLVSVSGLLAVASSSQYKLSQSHILDSSVGDQDPSPFNRALAQWSKALAQLEELSQPVAERLDYSPSTFTLSANNLEIWLPKIITLIEANKRDPRHPDFPLRGGVVGNYYSANYFRRFVSDGGQVLLQRSSVEGAEKVDGFILYYNPKSIPRWDLSVPESLRDMGDVSFVDLVLVDPSRPKGTFSRLFSGMMARLQFTNAEYSMGYVFGGNERSRSALEHLGHVDQALLAVDWRVPGGNKADFIPMVLPVHPKLRKLFAPSGSLKSE